jgi:hypothetical protein
MTTQKRPFRRFILVAAVMAVALAACSGAAAPSPSAPVPAGPDPTPVPTADAGSSGGGSGGNVGSGVIVNAVPVDPAAGEPRIVTPKPGQKNTHPVGPTSLQASIDGRHVLVKVSWWSGVEPCNVLDSVRVDRSGNDIAITIIEGASDLDVACIEIAQLKATIVDLGDLQPGTYTISAPNGEAPPIQVTIS